MEVHWPTLYIDTPSFLFAHFDFRLKVNSTRISITNANPPTHPPTHTLLFIEHWMSSLSMSRGLRSATTIC